MERKIAAARTEDDRAVDRGRPDDFVAHQPTNVFEQRIAVVTRLADLGIGVGAKHCLVRSVLQPSADGGHVVGVVNCQLEFRSYRLGTFDEQRDRWRGRQLLQRQRRWRQR